MGNYKLVPFEPTPEMIEAAEEVHMPFGDMDLAIRMAILAAPDVQEEPVPSGWMLFPKAAWDFLYGTGELNGFSFGDRPRAQPPFWWRMVIRKMLVSAPQPAEQQSDITRLVEALESAKNLIANHSGEVLPDEYAGDQIEQIDAALAAYRKGGE